MDLLNKDWKQVKVGEYVISVKGKKPKRVSNSKTKECSIPYINIKAFEKNIIDEYTDGAGCVLCEDGDFLMVWDGSRSGYVGKAIKGALGSTLVKLNFPDIENNYAYYFLQSKFIEINTRAKGVGIPHVDPNILWNYDLLIPPKPTQQLIVSKIEELFSELDKGIENLRIAQQQLKTYRQTVLKYAFEGRLTNKIVKDGELPKGWKNVSITELTEKNKHALKAGPFGSSLKKEFYVESGYKIYGQEQVISGDAFYGDYYINEEKYQELNSCKIKPFDILISLVGTVGKVLLLPENCKAGIINPRLIKISLDRNIYSPKFFKYYFESSFVKSFYGAETRGTTMDVLNLGIIKTIPFPLCSIEEQNKIVQSIESRLSVADKMEESINQSLQQAEALRQSILKKAFEGRLVKEQETQLAKEIPIERKVLASWIIHLNYNNSRFGLTKFQKTLYLCEQFAQVDYATNYEQERAGPYDREFTQTFRQELKEKDIFQEETKVSLTHFVPGSNAGIYSKDYAKYFRNKGSKIRFVIELLQDKKTDEAELIATIYAVWNNKILQKKYIDEKCIINDIYNWSEQKKKYTENEIKETYKWMCEVKLIPTGFGNVISIETQSA